VGGSEQADDDFAGRVDVGKPCDPPYQDAKDAVSGGSECVGSVDAWMLSNAGRNVVIFSFGRDVDAV
jgi:hypothetical protein